MHIICEKDESKLQKMAAKELELHLKEFNKLPVLLLLSGGSSLGLLNFLDLADITKNITISFLDERYTNRIENTNFYHFSKAQMYMYLQKNKNEIFDVMKQKNETVEDTAQRFENFLHSWKNNHKNGKVIITQGVGEDGHTAGIMPFSENKSKFEELLESDKWVIGYNVGDKNPFPQRVTVTNTFLKKVVDVSIVYAKGENKKKVLKKVLDENIPAYILPAKILYEMKEVHIFCDTL